MKKQLLFLLLITVLTACSTKDKFTITGEVSGIEDQKVSLVLEKYDGMEVQEFEPVQIVNGKFQFKGTLNNAPSIVSFKFEEKNTKLWKQFIIDNSNMTASISVDKKYNGGVSLKAELNGSESHDKYEEFHNELNKINGEARQSASLYRTLGNNGELPMEKWSSEDLATLERIKKIQKESELNLNKYLTSLITADNDFMKLFAVPNLAHWIIKPFDEFDSSQKAFDQLSEPIKTSQARMYFEKQIFRKFEYSRLAKEATVGNTYKDFTQNTPNGEAISASSLIKENKYVLLDFWASWCGPCRAENPNLLKAYNKYHEKGFDVLAISVDEKKEPWIKAIKKDALPWTQVSDLKGFKNEVAKLYAVTGVPSSFLIDQEGTIIATDLRGEELNKKLEELLGK